MSSHSRFRVRTAVSALATAVALTVGALVPAAPALAATPAPTPTSNPTVTIHTTTSAAGFVHPGIGVSTADLEQARKEVRSGTEPWASYYAAMSQTRWAQTTVTSSNQGAGDGVPATDAFNSQGVEAKFIEDAFSAYTQAIQYYITGDPVYRENGMRIIRIWSHMDPTKYVIYPDARIHSPIPLMNILAAAEIFRASSVNPTTDGYDTAWKTSDTADLTHNLVQPLTDTFLYSNDFYLSQQAYANVGAIAGYIFTDNRARYDQAVEWSTVNATGSDQQTSGALTSLVRVIKKNDPLNTYHRTFVQVQEMGRDQAHAWDGLNALATTAQMLTTQGTKLDPVKGTVSTKRNAVTPYAFGDNRLLAGFEAYTAFMIGKDIPWIDTTGGPGTVSEAYRGRLFEPIDQIYDVYAHDLKVNVKRAAPSVAQLYAQADGPTFYWGTQAYNSWNSNPDYSPQYWLSLPKSVAGKTRPVASNALIQVEQRSTLLDSNSRVAHDGSTGYVRMTPAGKKGTTIAVRTLLYDNLNGYSPVGVLIRTNGPATLELRKDRSLAPYHTLPLPDTHGQWRYFVYDMGYSTLPGSLGGENLAYFTVLGKHVKVDIDSVNLQAASQLTPPAFGVGDPATVIGVVGATVTRSLGGTAAAGQTVSYEGQTLPSQASVDASSGTLSWTPSSTKSPSPALVIALDGTTDSVLTVDFVAAANRSAAIDAALSGYDPKADYVTATQQALLTTLDGVRASAGTADDATFAAGLISIQDAVKKLQLLNPVLADGSLDYVGLTTSPSLSQTSIANMTDNDMSTTSGDLTAPFVLDFGAGFRVKADAFGLQARYGFANRSQGANVYGSNDGTNWVLLTPRETTDTTAQDYQMETIPVRSEVAGKSFRFVKVQVDDPGVATDPAYPGLSSFSELRIDGTRIETVQALTKVSLSSNDATPGQAQNGDTVTLAIESDRPISEPAVTIEGQKAAVTGTDDQHWSASVVLPQSVAYSRALEFSIDYTTTDGQVGATTTATSDGSALQLWNTHVAFVSIDKAWVDASSKPFPGTTAETSNDNAWRMFDGDITTATDTVDSTGSVTIKPTDGSSLVFDAVRVHPRLTFPDRGNGTVVQSSTDGGTTWTTLATITGMTNDQQWYVFPLAEHVSVPMVRVLDAHGGFTNIAELQLVQYVQQDTVQRSWVDASTPQWPGTGTSADNGWRMFDGDLTTAPDTTTSDGWVTVTPDDGSALGIDLVSIRPRAGEADRANGTVIQGSDDGGVTWTTLVTISGVTSDASWYTFPLSSHQSVKMLRVLDDHEGRVNIAELQLLQYHPLPV